MQTFILAGGIGWSLIAFGGVLSWLVWCVLVPKRSKGAE